MKLLVLFSALTAFTAASPITLLQRSDCGLPNSDLCDRKYTKLSYIGTHNSAFVGDLDDPRMNQHIDVTGQLNAGVRFLQAQTHKNAFGILSMCHTDCWLLDAGSLVNYLSKVKSWMDDNPNAVITILLTNDGVDVKEYADVFDRVNLKHYAFVPSTSPGKLDMDDWPTLGELIDAGTRLVMFMDYGADETKIPFILDEFKYFFETPFDVTDPTFDLCNIDRPPNANGDNRMYIVNHFLQKRLGDDILIPDVDSNFQTNAASGPGSIGAQVKLCEQTHGRPPNFVLLDMFHRGDWFEAQQNTQVL